MDITSRGVAGAPPRLLQYRKHVRITSQLMKYFSIIFFFTFISLLIAYFFIDHKKEIYPVEIVIFSGVVWLFYYLQYHFIMRPLAISKIQAYPEHLFIERGSEKTTIPYADIAEIKSAINKNIGGWFTIILKNKKSYRFTIVLERVDYIIDSIIKFNPALMPQEQYKKLRKHLILADHGWARLYDLINIKQLKNYSLYFFLLPAFFIALVYLKQSSEFFIMHPLPLVLLTAFFTTTFLGLLLMIFPSIIFAILDKHTAKRLEENPNNKSRDIVYELQFYKKLIPSYIALLLIFFGVIYKFDLNTVAMCSLSKNTQYLNLAANEILWVDTRFNCVNCKFSVKKDDVVITSDSIVGKVIGLPKEMVFLSNQEKDGRYIASSEEKEIPKESLAILTKNGKVTRLIDIKIIHGKITKDFNWFKL
jgi:hypothetical protein